MKRIAAWLPMLAAATFAQAHNGAAGAAVWHWHASDALGLLIVAGCVFAAFGGRGR